MENLVKVSGSTTVRTSGCPAGTYSCVFNGAFELPPKKDGNDYGPAIILKFKDDKGNEPSAIVAAQPTLKNRTGVILKGMLGRDLQPDEAIDWQQFEGQRFVVMVGSNKSGTGTTILEVIDRL